MIIKSFDSLLILLIVLTLNSCSTNNNNLDTMNGVYKSLGYGRIAKIENGVFFLNDVTSKSCIPLASGEIKDFGEAFFYKNDTISLQDGINKYFFVRIKDLPAICIENTPEHLNALAKKHDPVYNFETLWETFRDHYAYFELRNIDPEKMYKEYRPKISSEMSQAEFYLILAKMLDSFEDGHIDISATDEIEAAAEALYLKEKQGEKEEVEPKEHLRNYKVSKLVAEKYIPEGTYIKNGNIRWDILKNNIGYLQLNQMMGVANYNLSDTLTFRDYWMKFIEIAENSDNDNIDEIDGINSSLDLIMKDFENTDAIIIDVRFNGGGKDEVGLEVLKRLNDTEKIVFIKKGKMGDHYTPDNSVVQPASINPYKNPIYLLIGPESASATEIMALSSLSMPNITRIGSRTEGVFSDVLDKELPNGWEIDLSSEVYLDMNGINYESVGIPPDVAIGYEKDTQKFLQKVISDIENEGDAAIKKALLLIKENI